MASRTLDCDPVDGACARVVALLPDLLPDRDEVCTEIYGGPERYLVEGTVDGVATSVDVTRTNGCAIARFDRLREALGPEGPAP